MKKILLSLCVVMMMIVAGCGGANNASDTKTLRVGSTIDFAPFEFQDESQKDYQGFDMDLIRAVAKEMGKEADIQNIGFDGLIPALQAKNIDLIISGMTITEERKQNVAFSDPYYDSGLTIIVRGDEEGITSFKDLAGKKVAVQIGTTSSNEVHKIDVAEIKEFNTPADIIVARWIVNCSKNHKKSAPFL